MENKRRGYLCSSVHCKAPKLILAHKQMVTSLQIIHQAQAVLGPNETPLYAFAKASTKLRQMLQKFRWCKHDLHQRKLVHWLGSQKGSEQNNKIERERGKEIESREREQEIEIHTHMYIHRDGEG